MIRGQVERASTSALLSLSSCLFIATHESGCFAISGVIHASPSCLVSIMGSHAERVNTCAQNKFFAQSFSLLKVALFA